MPARTSAAAHIAPLFAAWHNLEFIDLQEFHVFHYTWPPRKNNVIRRGRPCVFKIHVHLVFVTKHRRGIFNDVCIDFEAKLVELDGEDDHVHLLMNSLEGVSSRVIRKKLWGGALWSPCYFVGSCGGAPIGIIRQHLEQQHTPG